MTAAEEELAGLLAEAAASVALPEGGPAAILELAGDPLGQQRRGRALASRALGAGRATAPQGAGRSDRRRLPPWRAVVLPAAVSLAVLALAAGLIGAFAGGSTPQSSEHSAALGPESKSSAASTETQSADAAAPPAAAGMAGAAYGSAGSAAGLPAGQQVSSAGSARQAPAPLGSPGTSAGPQVVTTGSIELGVRRSALGDDVDRLNGVALAAGGFVSASNVTETGQHPGGSVTLRAPAARFGRLVSAAEAVGALRSLQTSSNDVSSQVDDLTAQITALEDARGQLEALLKRAGKISDLLAVDNQIESTQSQIEQLQVSQREIADQVAYSTLSVGLEVVNPPRPLQRHEAVGFSAAWRHAVRGFVGGVRATVADLGVVLFSVLGLAALAALVVLIARLGRRLVLRRLA